MFEAAGYMASNEQLKMIDELAGEILKTIGILMQMLPEPVKKVLENRAVQGVMKVTGGVSEIATGCGACSTVAGCVQGIPLIVFGTNMAFEGIQDLWYTLRGELDHESKNLIKEATGHKVDNLVELAEIGMSIYSGKVASKKITGKLGEESEKLSGLLKKTRKPVSIVTRTKRLVKKFMPKKRYRKFKVVDIEELSKRQCLKPNIQLFAEKSSKVRVGQWMSKNEYEKFLKTGEIPRSNVLRKGKEGFMKQANIGDYYVEFDINEALLTSKNEELGWWLIKSKNKTYLKLAEMRKVKLPDPIGENIKHIFTKGGK